MHPTGGSRRVFRQVAWLEAGSGKTASSRPAHQRVTQTVGCLLRKGREKEIKMMHSRVKVLVLLIVTLFALTGIEQVYADREVADQDYSLVTSNNEFVFVMFIPDEDIRINEELRRKYPCSGLYRNDGSESPIWTANWYARWVFVHPDGKHLVRIGRWPSLKFDNEGHRLYDELALAFYRNGTELEQYTVQDLVANPDLLPISVSHYEWRKDISFDEATGILKVKTETDETYEFNVFEMSPESSEGVTSCNPNALYKSTHESKRKLWYALVTIPLLLVGVVLWIQKMIKAKKVK